MCKRRLFLLETRPVILSDFQLLADVQPNGNSKSIANENVKNPDVPPAFIEIDQQMRKGNL